MTEKTRGKSWIFVWVFGILLPVYALIVESVWHVCAEEFFDPIPTLWHVAVVAFVPLANLFVRLSLRWQKTEDIGTLGLINGIGIGISLYYSILFLPLSVAGAVSILYFGVGLLAFGIGLLPLAPLLSLISGMICRRDLQRVPAPVKERKHAALYWGLALALSLVLLPEIPLALTRIGVQMATSESANVQITGLRLLRLAGNEEHLLRMCYHRYRPQRANFLSLAFSPEESVHPNEARELFYRVTGTPFNSLPIPKAWGRRTDWFRRFDDDGELGGTSVASRIQGLSLTGSRMDGVLEAHPASGYLEWTMIFHNRTREQQEARAQVLLPPGGVVSRLTLWVHGEEREAAFSTTGKVREAYTNVAVRQRRDPVLVTFSGPDRVMVQGFPVPAGGEMKIRLGVTFPLLLDNLAQGAALLPLFLERNFDIPADKRHAVWIESDVPVTTMIPQLSLEHPAAQQYILRGNLPDSDLSDTRGALQVQRPVEARESWARDPFQSQETFVRQYIQEITVPAPARVIFVIDGSRGMKAAAPNVAAALSKLPEGIEFGVLLASDTVEELVPLQIGTQAAYHKAAALLSKRRFQGGCDNVPALEQAHDAAAAIAAGVIVWIHAEQPVTLQSVEGLQQRWDRQSRGATLFDTPVANGPNRILEALKARETIISVPFSGDAGLTLQRLFSRWSGGVKQYDFARESYRQDADDSFPALASEFASAPEASVHLVRLWAYNEVLNGYFSGSFARVQEITQMAAAYQLVTPVSGAVVLETEQQYKEAGLQPMDPATVPRMPSAGSGTPAAIPEPGTLPLLGIGLLLLFARQRQRRQR